MIKSYDKNDTMRLIGKQKISLIDQKAVKGIEEILSAREYQMTTAAINDIFVFWLRMWAEAGERSTES